jgi:hypothetical protein
MSAVASTIYDFKAKINIENKNRCDLIIYKLVDLFVEQSNRLSEEHICVFDELMIHLKQGVNLQSLVEVSKKISHLEKAPINLIKELCFEKNITISSHVLKNSPRISTSDIVDIAQHYDEPHLMAISQRKNLQSHVTDALLNREFKSVWRSTLENKTAQFSNQGYLKAVEMTQQDPRLRVILLKREDVPPQVLEALSKSSGIPSQVASQDGASSHEPKADCQTQVEVDILQALDAKNKESITQILAQAVNVTPTVVSKAFADAGFDSLLLIVRAAKLSWDTFERLLEMKLGNGFTEVIRKKASESYDKMVPAHAQRVLKALSSRS